MKRLLLVYALLPAVVLAAPQTSGGGAPAAGPAAGAPSAPDDTVRMQRMQKRMRLAATLGLAEVLDLDDQGTLRVRDIITRYSDKRMPLQRQLRDGMRVVRDAARGDQAAMGQVDAALGHVRDARAQLQSLDNELFQQLTQGLSPEKKAKTALFMARFRERAHHMAMMHGMGTMRGGPGWGRGRAGGPGGGPGFGPRGALDGERMGPGPGPGPGRPGMMGPGAGPDRQASAMMDSGEPDLEDWFAVE